MLQLSLDWLTRDEAIKTIAELYDVIDIAEIGTPMLFEYGLGAVKAVKDRFPEMKVLADMKIIDAGKLETLMAISNKADVITVMGAANDLTIKLAIEEAHAAGVEVMVDLLGVRAIKTRAVSLDAMGADYICFHTAFDLKSNETKPLEDLQDIKKSIHKSRIAVAGGITLQKMSAVETVSPDVVIVGGGIMNSEDRRAVTNKFYQYFGLRKE